MGINPAILKMVMFEDGIYEVPLFIKTDDGEKVAGLAIVCIDQGRMTAEINIDEKIAKLFGISLTFVEENTRIDGRRYKLVAEKKES